MQLLAVPASQHKQQTNKQKRNINLVTIQLQPEQLIVAVLWQG